MKAIAMFTAQVAGQQNNAHYPHPHTVTTAADLEAVARLDHVVAEYVGGRRSAGSFVASNCLVIDVDNPHSEEQAKWVTPASLTLRLAGVALMTAPPATARGRMVPSRPDPAFTPTSQLTP
ncbi:MULTISPECIES: hypothetical protein [unclassified Corynebacterium]|uniref:hypothetical protein n=1 Tax=unclassified Corynebacterium TaxID=2624378 RepID=UPI001EF70C0A|nr:MULTISPECIES: hypothetical protein [unclassified Corynebacterium]MCG7258074.1 hypothetical protein [Corynebacterium sp. ACRQK]MCG7262507.1 hypothetical protein [Corynebacterium sp. ACRQL]